MKQEILKYREEKERGEKIEYEEWKRAVQKRSESFSPSRSKSVKKSTYSTESFNDFIKKEERFISIKNEKIEEAKKEHEKKNYFSFKPKIKKYTNMYVLKIIFLIIRY